MNQSAKIYLAIVSAVGIAILMWAIWQLQYIDNFFVFGALMGLGLIVQSTATISRHAGTTFSVNQAVNLAVLVILGVPAAIVVAAVGTSCSWAINTFTAKKGWKGSAQQLVFNVGMITIVLAITGATYYLLQSVGVSAESPLSLQIFGWVLIAIVNDQTNILLVAGIVYFQQNVSPYDFWQQHKWLMPMNMVITIFGSSLLANAVATSSLSGIALFCLPLLLTSYSFRLYIQKSEQQLDALRQRSEELEASNNQLNQLVKAKDRFSAVLSHDMRTPLTSIRLYGQMLTERQHLLPEEKKMKMLNAIVQSERTLAGMVDNLLEIERINSDEPQPMKWMKTDLAIELARVAATLEIQLVAKNLSLVTTVHQQPLWVVVDQASIRKVIINLISNAIKYTPANGEIHLDLVSTNDHAILIIKDTGYGIPADKLESIFEPYYRVPDHTDRALGTGLGLSIVKSLVDLHKGSVSVASVVGAGTQFTVQLPKQRGQLSAEPAFAQPTQYPSDMDAATAISKPIAVTT